MTPSQITSHGSIAGRPAAARSRCSCGAADRHAHVPGAARRAHAGAHLGRPLRLARRARLLAAERVRRSAADTRARHGQAHHRHVDQAQRRSRHGVDRAARRRSPARPRRSAKTAAPRCSGSEGSTPAPTARNRPAPNGAEPAPADKGSRPVCPTRAPGASGELERSRMRRRQHADGGLGGGYACEDGSQPGCEDGSAPVGSDGSALMLPRLRRPGPAPAPAPSPAKKVPKTSDSRRLRSAARSSLPTAPAASDTAPPRAPRTTAAASAPARRASPAGRAPVTRACAAEARDRHVRLGSAAARAASRSLPPSASRTAPCSARQLAVAVVHLERERAWAARRQPQRRAERKLRLERAAARLHGRAIGLDLLDRADAEEAERQVHRLGLQQAHIRGRAAAPARARRRRRQARPSGELLAERRRRVDRHEQPRCGRARHRRGDASAPRAGVAATRWRSRAEQRAAEHVHRHGRRAVAHVGAAAGKVDRARHRALSRPGDGQPHEPDRLLGAAAARAGDARDADADIGAQALARAVGERLGDLAGDGAVALDQLRGDARLRDLDVVAVGDDRALDVAARSRRGRSGAPRAGRRCTTRRSRSCARLSSVADLVVHRAPVV